MTDEHTLVETERAMQSHVAQLELDFEAAHAVSSIYRAANAVYAEISGKNEDFKRIWDSIRAFRADQYLWLQVADNTYDSYMIVQQRKHTL